MVDIRYLYKTVYSVSSCCVYDTDYHHFITILNGAYQHDLVTWALLRCHNGYLGLLRTLHWQWSATVLANNGKFEANVMHVDTRICTYIVICVSRIAPHSSDLTFVSMCNLIYQSQVTKFWPQYCNQFLYFTWWISKTHSRCWHASLPCEFEIDIKEYQWNIN